MKLSKKIPFYALLCALLINLCFLVAADEIEVINDDQGDVIVISEEFEEFNTTDKKPNIDIKKISYSHVDGSSVVTILFEVYGEIEDRGSLDPDDISGLFNSVIYSVTFTTSGGDYTVTYVNKKCQIIYPDLTEGNITEFSTLGGELEISVTLEDSTETFDSITAETIEFNVDLSGGGEYYMDLAPDEFEFSADAGGPYSGKVGEGIQFYGEAYNLYGLPTTTYTYSWDFGDDSTSDEQNPVHSYNAPGRYNVTLTVIDDSENTAQDITYVTVTSEEPNNGSNGGNGGTNGGDDNSDTGVFLFVAVIAIIIIIGVVVLIFVIRR